MQVLILLVLFLYMVFLSLFKDLGEHKGRWTLSKHKSEILVRI